MATNWKALLKIVRQRTPDVWRIAGGPENPTHYTISSFHEKLGYQIHSMQWVKERWPDTYESMKPTYIKDAAAIVVAVNHFEEAATAAIERDELKRQRDQLQRDLDAALTVMANHDLSLGDAIKMPLKQDTQIIELTKQRDELLAACKAVLSACPSKAVVHETFQPAWSKVYCAVARIPNTSVKGMPDG